MMAGMELESDLSEPEVMEVIKVVLKSYKPEEFDDEEGALFVTTSTCF